MRNKDRCFAFTLAEVLITLAVIGVVAALTIPSIVSSYKDKQYNSSRLKALHTFGDAGKNASINGEINGQPDAKAFVNNVLSKYLKVAKVCDKALDCDFPTSIQPNNPAAEKITDPDTNLAAWNKLGSGFSYAGDYRAKGIYLTSADGFSAKLFYNPKCTSNSHEAYGNYKIGVPTTPQCKSKECWHLSFDAACMNVIYDMNGVKAPNRVGEDIGFVTVFWSGPSSTAVAPGMIPYSVNSSISGQFSNTQGARECASKGSRSTPYTLPSIDELSSLTLNYNLSSISYNDNIWSGTAVNGKPGSVWNLQGGVNGYRNDYLARYYGYVWCVRR